jgi:hypothetical protein
MFTPRWREPEGEPLPNRDLSAFVELVLQVLRDLHAIHKEVKYSNWLKLIELKSNGLYDECRMKDDFKHFGLEE